MNAYLTRFARAVVCVLIALATLYAAVAIAIICSTEAIDQGNYYPAALVALVVCAIVAIREKKQ